MIAEKWCRVEIYNEYLKKITSLLGQINTVENMQKKAFIELDMIKSQPESESRTSYKKRLDSTLAQCEQRLTAMNEELKLIQGLKENLEEEMDFLRSK